MSSGGSSEVKHAVDELIYRYNVVTCRYNEIHTLMFEVTGHVIEVLLYLHL